MSKAEVLKLCGVSDETFRTVIRPMLAADHSRRETSRGNPLRFFAPAVVAVLVQRAAAADIDDPMLAGDGSPALERYRLARAKLAELDFSQRCGQLVPVADFVGMLGPLSAILRGAGDELGIKYGADAQRLLNDSLDEFGRQVEERLSPLVPAVPTTTTTEVSTDDDGDKQA
jgi:hypothetical protein